MYKTIEISIKNVKKRSGPANYRKFGETEPWPPKVLSPFFLPPLLLLMFATQGTVDIAFTF